MGKYFGTDGFRGEVNKDLTVEHAYKIGRFIGWYYGRDHKASIAIGKDTRRSGYMLEHALMRAVIPAHVCPGRRKMHAGLSAELT